MEAWFIKICCKNRYTYKKFVQYFVEKRGGYDGKGYKKDIGEGVEL